MRIAFLSSALREIVEAIEHYDDQAPSLGHALDADLQRTLDTIVTHRGQSHPSIYRPPRLPIADANAFGLTTGAGEPIVNLPPQSGRHGPTGPPRVPIRGIFFAVSRTTFLIDGFNLYYSAREGGKATGGRGTKWLDVVSLCES